MNSLNELEEIIIASLALSLAFTIAFFSFSSYFFYHFLITLTIISPSFILHELAHKYVAIFYRAKARFFLNRFGLILALISSFAGFIIAIPGAVYILTPLNRKQYGITALAGNIVNLLLSLISLILSSFLFIPIGNTNALLLSFKMNAFLAMFNLIPFPPLDGEKVFRWNPFVWAFFFALSIYIYAFV